MINNILQKGMLEYSRNITQNDNIGIDDIYFFVNSFNDLYLDVKGQNLILGKMEYGDLILESAFFDNASGLLLQMLVKQKYEELKSENYFNNSHPMQNQRIVKYLNEYLSNFTEI